MKNLIGCVVRAVCLGLGLAACGGSEGSVEQEMSGSASGAFADRDGSAATDTPPPTSGGDSGAPQAGEDGTPTAVAPAEPSDDGAAAAGSGSSEDAEDAARREPSAELSRVSFAQLYADVFEPQGCTAGYCHGGGQGGLSMLDAATTRGNLVGVDAQQPVCGHSARVVPGDPEASILWYRVRPISEDDEPPCAGEKMPADVGTGLPEEEAQLVYDWIAGGAL